MTAPFIIDTDVHVTEPPDLWASRLSKKKWGDKVLHVKWNPDLKMEFWYIENTPVFSAWGSANFGWSGGILSAPPTRDHVHPAAYDASARLKEMDLSGIYAAVVYPNLGAILMPMYKQFDAPELMLESVQAYNDFLIDWGSVAPERFVAMACLPLWDVDASVREIERAAKIGHRGLLMSGAPQDHGWPFLADRRWDRVWAAAQAHNLPISFHVGGGDILDDVFNMERIAAGGMEANYARYSTKLFLDNGSQLADLLTSGVLARYPGLRFAIVESGIGFLPFCLETLDYHAEKVGLYKARPEFTMKLSEYFHKHISVNYWFERLEGWMIERLGADNLLFETDFPHVTCLHGESVKRAIENGLSAQPKEVQDKILWKNAAKLYNVKTPQAA